jgi:hypothetical protein
MKNDIGFYTVNNVPYSNKFEAVLAAQQINAEVEWNFFDETFSKVDWSLEPDQSLDYYYRLRAEQIRSSYDYVIVFCSGGADSTNVIKTFINNNIKVDEVIGIAPMSGLKNWDYNPSNTLDLNIISETKFALLPLLDELSSKHGIKTTLYDFFEDMVQYKTEEWYFESCGNVVTPLTSHFTNVHKLPHIDKLIESGKRIALVYGTEKPIIKIAPSGDMSSVFADAGVNYLNMPDSRTFPNVDRVLFYWSNNLPELLVKQAHVVSRAVHTDDFKEIYHNHILLSKKDMLSLSYQDILNYNEKNNITSLSKDHIYKKYTEIKSQYVMSSSVDSYRSIYQRKIVPFIYPSTYVKNLWQAQKVSLDDGLFTRDQDWIHILHKGTRISDIILAGSKTLYNSISPKYLTSKGTGFKTLMKRYKFGNSKNLKSTSNSFL